jgi:hypothetical protein
MVGWLITWEWTGDHAKVENKIAAVLRWRLSSKIVREIVEALYANSQYTPSEFVRYCVGKNGKNNPYPARNGVPWGIYCGHNPHLYARIVDGLRVYETENGESAITWKERPIPNHLQEMLRNGRTKPQ